MTSAENIAVIILAAGASSRLGSPKQLLPYINRTLLDQVVSAAVDSIAGSVIVVLGAHRELINPLSNSTKVKYIFNPEWQEGMASSLRFGINEITLDDPGINAAVIMLCDQPHVSAGLVNQIISAHQASGKAIVACSYKDTLGVPAFFHKGVFPALLRLKGDMGAKSVIQQHTREVEVIDFPGGSVDIDTEADYRRLMGKD